MIRSNKKAMAFRQIGIIVLVLFFMITIIYTTVPKINKSSNDSVGFLDKLFNPSNDKFEIDPTAIDYSAKNKEVGIDYINIKALARTSISKFENLKGSANSKDLIKYANSIFVHDGIISINDFEIEVVYDDGSRCVNKMDSFKYPGNGPIIGAVEGESKYSNDCVGCGCSMSWLQCDGVRVHYCGIENGGIARFLAVTGKEIKGMDEPNHWFIYDK